MTAKEAIQALADEAEKRGLTADQEAEVAALVRGAVSEEAAFPAWLCVVAELADREARREGYEGQAERAMERALKVCPPKKNQWRGTLGPW